VKTQGILRELQGEPHRHTGTSRKLLGESHRHTTGRPGKAPGQAQAARNEFDSHKQGSTGKPQDILRRALLDGIASEQATPANEDLPLEDLEGGIVGISSRDIPPGQPILTSFYKARTQKSHIPDRV
jgi:hypothetical protein